jgi:hypothetical protein
MRHISVWGLFSILAIGFVLLPATGFTQPRRQQVTPVERFRAVEPLKTIPSASMSVTCSGSGSQINISTGTEGGSCEADIKDGKVVGGSCEQGGTTVAQADCSLNGGKGGCRGTKQAGTCHGP